MGIIAVSKHQKNILPFLVFMGVGLIWESVVRIFQIPLYILPAPSMILKATVENFSILLYHGGTTLVEAIAGMAIAIILAVILSIMMDWFPNFKGAIYPLLVVSQTLPIIVLAPILIIYFGFGIMPKIIIVVMMCFFPIVVSFSDGLNEVDKNQVNLIRSYGASKLMTYRLVKIPSAIPSLLSGTKVAATYSITGAVVGEWLSSQSGLGYYMLRVKNAYMLDKVFACVLVIVLLSLFMNCLVKLMIRGDKQ